MASVKPRLLLTVKNLERTITFYRQYFQWEPEWEDDNFNVVQMKITDLSKAILSSNPQLDPKPFMDVAYVAPSKGQRFYLTKDNLVKEKEKLESQGLTQIELEIDPGFGQLLTVPDPDGYIVSLWEELYMPDEDILALYQHGPERLVKALEGLTEDMYDLVRAEGKWSIRQTAHHLIDSDITTFNRIKFALAESGREYTHNPYDPNTWESGTEYVKRPLHTEVILFKHIRQHVIELCESLPNALDRYINTQQGKLTVRKMIKMAAGHSKGHIEQIEKTRSVHNVYPY